MRACVPIISAQPPSIRAGAAPNVLESVGLTAPPAPAQPPSQGSGAAANAPPQPEAVQSDDHDSVALDTRGHYVAGQARALPGRVHRAQRVRGPQLTLVDADTGALLGFHQSGTEQG
jgi:hypothetical protein